MAVLLARGVSRAPADTPSAWRAALDQFLRELSQEEQFSFRTASMRPDKPEALLTGAMLSEVQFSLKSPARGALKRLEHTIQALDQFKVVVDIFAEIYPTGLAPIWGCIRLVMQGVANSQGQTAQKWQEYFDDLAEKFEALTRVLPRLREYERMYDNRRLFLALQAAYLGIIEFCMEVMNTFRKANKGPFSRMRMPGLWKSLTGAFKQKMKNLDASLEHVKEEAQTAHMMALAEMRTGEAREDWDRLIQFLTQGDKYRKLQATINQVRHPGTCEWLGTQKAFMGWRFSPEPQGFWLHGPVGSGKTVSCSYAIEHVKPSTEESQTPCAYYFCDYLDGRTLPATAFFESIIGQLLNCGVSRLLQDFVGKQYKCGRFPDFHLSPPEALDILVKILTELKQFGPTFIFIDGIDECEEAERRHILSSVHKILSDTENTALKVFISSRDMPDISQSLKEWPTAKLVVANVNNDIRSYVEDQVRQHFQNEASDDDQERCTRLVKLIIPKLVECADGMFLLASMQLALVFAAATEYEIEAVLDDLPRGIVETYTRILQRIANSSRTLEAKERVRRTFQWVYAASRPLSAQEITEAVSFSHRDETWDERKIPHSSTRVIDDCRNLVVLQGPQGDETARFTHSTVQEFLLSPPKNEQVTYFHFSPKEAHLLAAETTVSYLSFSDFETSLVYKGRSLSLTDMPVPEQTFIDTALRQEMRQNLTKRIAQSAITFRRADSRGIDFNFARRTSEAAQGRRRRSDDNGKYKFLDYASSYWLNHCAAFTPESLVSWKRFRNLVLYKSLEFDFKPWEGKWTPPGLPDLAAFDWALENGNLALLVLLAATRQLAQADISVLEQCIQYEFRSGTTPLKRALQLKSPEILAYLLQFVEPQMLTWERVFEAVSHGGVRLQLILEAGADPKIASTTRTALHQAAKLGHVDSIEQLLAYGAGINARDSFARTPLHTAIYEGNEMAALFLLEGYELEMDTRDSLGHTGLMDACEKGMVHVVRMLVEGGADVNVVSTVGRPILHLAVSQGRQEIVEILLLADNLEVNVQDNSLYSALHEAAEIDHGGIADLLLKRGMDPGLKDENGELALHYSCGNGVGHVYRLLLDFGMKEYLNVTGPMFNMTPLQWAVRRGRLENTRALIDHGADVNVNRSGKTALHFAAEAGDVPMVRLLVGAGASVMEKEWETGKTALQLAADGGFDEVVGILNEAMTFTEVETGKAER